MQCVLASLASVALTSVMLVLGVGSPASTMSFLSVFSLCVLFLPVSFFSPSHAQAQDGGEARVSPGGAERA